LSIHSQEEGRPLETSNQTLGMIQVKDINHLGPVVLQEYTQGQRAESAPAAKRKKTSEFGWFAGQSSSRKELQDLVSFF